MLMEGGGAQSRILQFKESCRGVLLLGSRAENPLPWSCAPRRDSPYAPVHRHHCLRCIQSGTTKDGDVPQGLRIFQNVVSIVDCFTSRIRPVFFNWYTTGP